jgi:hypothetical protein
MIGLLRYHGALLIRSSRWVAPLLVFGVVVASATAGGSPAPDAFGFAAAALVPTCAWLVRIVVTAEPGAARACAAAAAGAGRSQAGALVVAVGAGVVLSLGSAPILLLTASADAPAGRPAPSIVAVIAAGLIGELVCVLVGVAVGALANPPVLRMPAAAVLATGLLVVVALVAQGSPASAAIRAVVGGGRRAMHLPLLELGGAAALAVAAVLVSALVARSRGCD